MLMESIGKDVVNGHVLSIAKSDERKVQSNLLWVKNCSWWGRVASLDLQVGFSWPNNPMDYLFY